jgi:hypothetical protein
VARTKRIFVGFAVEDKNYRDLLRGQSKLGDSPIEYTDMSVKEPWDSSWKTRCRQRITGCDGFIALLSKNVKNADGARWEIKCAIEEGVPVLGFISIQKTTTLLRRSKAERSSVGPRVGSLIGSTACRSGSWMPSQGGLPAVIANDYEEGRNHHVQSHGDVVHHTPRTPNRSTN